MAKAKAKRTQSENKPAEIPISAEDKIARLLGLLLIKDIKNQGDQLVQLEKAGFKITDIAAMLGISGNQVSVVSYQVKKAASKKAASKKAASKKAKSK
jgi:hypothetical protein